MDCVPDLIIFDETVAESHCWGEKIWTQDTATKEARDKMPTIRWRLSTFTQGFLGGIAG
jgi:hypothetical protein